jgi:hypothetical protein
VNTDELEAATEVARRRVLEIQAKLHRWASVRNGTCGEPGAGTTGTPGSGGDSGKPTGRNTGRAPRVDLTLTFCSVDPGMGSAPVRNRPPLAGLVRMGPGWRGPAPPALLSRLLSDAHAFQVREVVSAGVRGPAY